MPFMAMAMPWPRAQASTASSCTDPPAWTTWTEKAKAYMPGWSSLPVCVQKFVNVTPLEKKDS